MKRIEISDPRQCCGCTACSSVCSHDAITMISDSMGFLYPHVDENLCVDCGLCRNVCQFSSKYSHYQNFDTPIVYGVRHKNEEELFRSQSGGASWAIIQAFLEEPGTVYGAAFDTVYHVAHSKANTLEESQKFRYSKYVQSDLRDIFPQIKKELLIGSRVLFFGTGCQVAGLKAAIPQRLQEHLFTVDIVCHAAPSPAVWESFIHYIENKHKRKVKRGTFRNKKYGWHSHIETLEFEDGMPMIESTSFRKLFYDHVIVRPSCTKCYFTNLKRVSDLTICDFWGWEKYYSEWNDNKGVSVTLVNSAKGKMFFEKVKHFVDYRESDTTKCFQPQMGAPISVDYKTLLDAKKIFEKKGYIGLAKKYGDQSFNFLFKEKVRPLLKVLKLR